MKKREYKKPSAAAFTVKMQMLCASPETMTVKGYGDEKESGDWKDPMNAD